MRQQICLFFPFIGKVLGLQILLFDCRADKRTFFICITNSLTSTKAVYVLGGEALQQNVWGKKLREWKHSERDRLIVRCHNQIDVLNRVMLSIIKPSVKVSGGVISVTNVSVCVCVCVCIGGDP